MLRAALISSGPYRIQTNAKRPRGRRRRRQAGQCTTGSAAGPCLLVLALLAGSCGGFLPGATDLYGPQDPGIISFQDQDVFRHLVNSSKPWMVQFYSSWCGHCRHFQPTFSAFGARVQGWTPLMGVGVVNCAAEINNDVCRHYEVMGYPTVKLFPANCNKSEMGRSLDGGARSAEDLTLAMARWIRQEQQKSPNHQGGGGDAGGPLPPLLTPVKSLSELWPPQAKEAAAAAAAVVIAETEKNIDLISQVILDLDAVTRNNRNSPLIVRPASSEFVLQTIDGGPAAAAATLTALAVTKEPTETKVLSNEPLDTLANLQKLVLDHYNSIYPASKLTSLKFSAEKEATALSTDKVKVKETKVTKVKSGGDQDVSRRRYTVYLNDVERALKYALTHEIGQRKVIGGQSLISLKNFLRVLGLYYPQSQGKVHGFISQLADWVSAHDDAIRGDDLEKRVRDLDAVDAVFRHSDEYVGCKGSQANYGGYPCALWTLWHVLTVNQLATGADHSDGGQEVLMAMVTYVRDFFGCRDCARHFLSMAEEGEAIRRDVATADDAVLWLWRAHNRVNQRLSGDISDDPVFPKAVFPDKTHCPQCYNEVVAGRNLDVEFHKDQVSRFLLKMYRTNMDLVSGMSAEGGGALPVPVDSAAKRTDPEEAGGDDETVDDTNFRSDPEARRLQGRSGGQWRQNRAEVTTTWFFSMADISLCFAIYLGSTLLICLVCYKFCTKRTIMKLVNSVMKADHHQNNYNYDTLKRV